MPQTDHSPPRGASRTVILVLAIIVILIVVIFVGRTIYHSDVKGDEQAGQVAPQDAPKGPHDLQTKPVQ